MSKSPARMQFLGNELSLEKSPASLRMRRNGFRGNCSDGLVVFVE
jgi:hypothetical protein